MVKNKKILIIGAHPDDEILGCGGTIAKLAIYNDVYTLLLGKGIMAREIQNYEQLLEDLRRNSIKAQKFLGIKNFFFENFPDNKFDTVPLLNIIKKVEEHINKIKPDIIFTHHHSDLNIDHRLTFEAVLTACRPQPNFINLDIYSFEIPSSTDWQIFTEEKIFKPNVFIDISDSIEKKMDALKFYKSEMREYPHSRSIKGIKLMAQDWGRKFGKKYIEAFELIRSVKNTL
ncbi:MAG: PIG-L deacetylase family protein [Promethearchaeota archaeon]